MEFRKKLEALEYLDHAGHKIALLLVGVATAAELLHNFVPQVGQWESMISNALHLVHWGGLIVAITYLMYHGFLVRNVGKEIAEMLDRKLQEQSMPFNEGPPQTPRSSTSRNRLYRYQRLVVTPSDVVFVSRADNEIAEILFDINEQYFERTAFALSRDQARRRNSEWIDKNQKVFMLVRDPARPETENHITKENFVGYTSIVPLNEIGADLYLRGLIKDKDLPASLICKPGEPTNMLLIFAIAMEPKHRREKSLNTAHLNLLLKAAEYHARMLASTHAGHHSGMYLWTQSEHESIVKHLKMRGFAGTSPPTKAADGFELLRCQFDALLEPSCTEQSVAPKGALVSSPNPPAAPLGNIDPEKR